MIKSTNLCSNSFVLRKINAELQSNGLLRDMSEYENTIRELRSRDRCRYLTSYSPRRNAIKHSLADSIGNWECVWNIDLALTLPSNHPASHSPNHRALSAFLVGYFSRVEAELFKQQSRRNRDKLIRFVVLEHADGVGWHTHAIIASPVNIGVMTTNKVLRRHWYKSVGPIRDKSYDPNRLYWSDIHRHDYIAYSLKHAIETSNCNSDIHKGLMCEYNTILPIMV